MSTPSFPAASATFYAFNANRTIASNSALGVFNLRDYGTNLTSGSDCTTALVGTIAAASANGGGTVILPPNFVVGLSASVARPSNVFIIGGGASTIVRALAGTNLDWLLANGTVSVDPRTNFIVNYRSVTVSSQAYTVFDVTRPVQLTSGGGYANFVVDGNQGAQTSGLGYGILASADGGVVLQGMAVQNCTEGVSLWDCQDAYANVSGYGCTRIVAAHRACYDYTIATSHGYNCTAASFVSQNESFTFAGGPTVVVSPLYGKFIDDHHYAGTLYAGGYDLLGVVDVSLTGCSADNTTALYNAATRNAIPTNGVTTDGQSVTLTPPIIINGTAVTGSILEIDQKNDPFGNPASFEITNNYPGFAYPLTAVTNSYLALVGRYGNSALFFNTLGSPVGGGAAVAFAVADNLAVGSQFTPGQLVILNGSTQTSGAEIDPVAGTYTVIDAGVGGGTKTSTYGTNASIYGTLALPNHPLSIANGGTGLSTIGAANTVLTSNGSSASWVAAGVTAFDSVVTAIASCTHYWPFNDAAGSSTVADRVGGASLTKNGNARLGYTPLARDGETSALLDQNTSDYFTFPTGIITGTGAMSMFVLLRPEQSTASANVFFSADNNGALTWYSDGSGFLKINLSNTPVSSTTLLPNGGLLPLTVVWNGTNTIVYVGLSVAITTTNGPRAQVSTGSVGRDAAGGGTNPYGGLIAKLAYFNAAITTTQIATILAAL